MKTMSVQVCCKFTGVVEAGQKVYDPQHADCSKLACCNLGMTPAQTMMMAVMSAHSTASTTSTEQVELCAATPLLA